MVNKVINWNSTVFVTFSSAACPASRLMMVLPIKAAIMVKIGVSISIKNLAVV